MQKVLLRLFLMTLGLAFALTLAEVGVRYAYPDGGIPAAHLESTSLEQYTSVHEDAEAGYLPVLGRGEYDTHGFLKNDYDVQKRRGKRLVFAGDSVTHRRRLLDALRRVYGEEKYEYWNAGVESFNTRQELVLYRRYNAVVKPDELILEFHNNDFRATPLCVREDGKFKVYEPGMSINPWLFEHSYLYRWAWPRADDRNKRARAVHDSLAEFKTLLAEQKVGFRIILLPMFKPLAEYNKSELWSRELSLQYFKELGLTYFDMLPVVEGALKEGLEITEKPGDTFHPNDLICARMAAELKRQGLIDL
ncbi:MAG: hypothetical protein KF760_32640 [Candidatus Eremiobacteraeota bacterium]|nr:hypothetical protein [Candidatus Eremiobacteraeota bacterium]MCW5871805.1 hypothetical protein [Candidatus Eremiobacteraeota bacterium]